MDNTIRQHRAGWSWPRWKIISWTTDSWVAQLIVKFLNENEELLLIERTESK